MTRQPEPFDTPNPLDTAIYLDTSIIVLHYGTSWGHPASRTKAALTRNFLERCAREEVALVVSLWTLEELRHAIFHGIYRRLAHRTGSAQTPKHAYAQYPHACQQVHQAIAQVEQALEAHPAVVVLDRPIDRDILDRALGYVFQYHLEPADALHVTLSLAEGVSSFATTDRAWLNVPGVRVYSPG